MSKKVKWIAGILLVFLIILSTNLVDRANFSKIKDTVTTIYEDRIVASDLLLDMVILFHQKERIYDSSDLNLMQQQNVAINRQVDALVKKFEQTKLTETEQTIFNSLKAKIQILREYEKSENTSKTHKYDETLDVMIQELQKLSHIQVKEGKEQMLISQEAMNTMNVFTKVEIALLVLMVISLLLIVFLKSKVKLYNS